MAKDHRIEELTDSLLQEKKTHERAAREAKERRVREAAQRKAREAAEFAQAFQELSASTTHLLEHHRDEAELLEIASTGFFREVFGKAERVEAVPAWEIATGTESGQSSVAGIYTDFVLRHRVMLAADGRAFLGTRNESGRSYSYDEKFREFSSLSERDRAVLGYCGLSTVDQVTRRVEECRAGTQDRE